MNKAVANERMKLFANFANTVAAAFLSVGVIGPALAYFYGLAATGITPLVIATGSTICVGCSGGLHLVGQAILGGIQE